VIKRTIEISQEPCTLLVERDQLLVVGRGESKSTVPPRNRIPCEDVGVIVVDNQETMYSHAALVRLLDYGAAVVVCGKNHLPAGLLLPLSSHTEQLWRLEAQLAMKKPLGKRLWAQIVAAKIRAQAANLEHAPEKRRKLSTIARNVRSGDAGGAEAYAARIYWSALFEGIELPRGAFRRTPGDRAAPPPNNLLDYGYAVVRASVARALVSSGLLPALGIQHCNRANAFALADDLVEPLRPMVDARVRKLAHQARFQLKPDVKAELLSVLTATVLMRGDNGPLQVSLPRYTASLARCLQGNANDLDIPVPAEPDREASEDAEDAP
jgi:CRISP-associated protein Cas1